MSINVGIDQISYYVPPYYLDLDDLATHRQLPLGKFERDLGQHKMAICPPHQDIITMGAAAALPLFSKIQKPIRTILFATETCVDQSKAAGLHLISLLNLENNCRVIELKQACYAGAGALRLATAMAALNPHETVLVVMADVARYEEGSLAEPTQGCGAVAMTVTTHPRLMTIDSQSGLFSDDVWDFWRPNGFSHALVSHKFSVRNYMEVMEKTFADFLQNGPFKASDMDALLYHAPFSKMVEKVHSNFCQKQNIPTPDILNALTINRDIGNAYTGSLFISLISLLSSNDQTHKRLGLFSYGSGCVAEYMTGAIQPNYNHVVYAPTQILKERHKISVETYYQWRSGNEHSKLLPQEPFVFQGIQEHQRIYTLNNTLELRTAA